MSTILIIIVLLLLFGGGGGYYAHGRYGGAGLGGVLGLAMSRSLLKFAKPSLLSESYAASAI